MQLSNLSANLKPSGIRQLFEQAKSLEQSRKIYHLEIGQPYFNPPLFVQEAVSDAVAEGAFRYVENRGDLDTRMALCDWLNSRFPQQLNASENVVFTVGGSEALVAVYAALLNSGDQVLVPTPAWSHYQEAVKLFNAEAIEVPLTEENGFLLNIDTLEKHWHPRCKILILNNPNNPTGVCYSVEFQKELIAWAKRRNLTVLIDEIYDYYNYSNEFASALNIPDLLLDNVIYINGFSKSLGITGLRVGYVLASKLMCNEINKIHQYLTVCASSLSLRVVAKTLRSTQLKGFFEQNLAEHKQRFLMVKESFASMPALKLSKANGAFYYFISFPQSVGDSNAVCQRLLLEKGVALTPGDVFGEGYSHHLRLCYSAELKDLTEALKHIKDFFTNL
ncbi:aminotransferase class I/II-fold pyridoxal phosphate-dependent enzyme [soil metagenome]